MFLWLQCLFDPNKEKNEDLDLSVFNPLSQEEAVSKIVWGTEKKHDIKWIRFCGKSACNLVLESFCK